MSLRVFVTTSDRYLWALRPFAHLFNRYWSELQPVVVSANFLWAPDPGAMRLVTSMRKRANGFFSKPQYFPFT